VPAQFATAATYYVSPNGNDSNPGTEAKPWKTPQRASLPGTKAKPSEKPQCAYGSAVEPGDTVLFGAGEYHLEETWQVKCAGTAEAPITFKAQVKGEVRISNSSILPPDGWKPVKGAINHIYQTKVGAKAMSVFQNGLPLAHDTKTHAINSVSDMCPNSFYGKDSTLYVLLDDGSDPKNSEMRVAPSDVVTLDGCHYTIFDGLTAEFGDNGFKAQEDSPSHVTIRNCILRSLGGQGIRCIPEHCLIEGNLFQRIGATKFQHAMYGWRPGIIVRNNIFEEISGAAIYQYIGEGKKDDNDWVRVRDLGLWQKGGITYSVGIYVPDSRDNWEISGNVFRKPWQYTKEKGVIDYVDMILWARHGNNVFDNEFHGEGKRNGISLQTSNNHIYNNKFIRCPSAVDSSKGSGNEVRNNVIWGHDTN
jgi:hypothetical protein